MLVERMGMLPVSPAQSACCATSRVHATTCSSVERMVNAWGNLSCACSASSPDGQPAKFTLCQMLFYVSAIVTHFYSRPTHPTACELVSIGKREKKRRQGHVARVAQQHTLGAQQHTLGVHTL